MLQLAFAAVANPVSRIPQLNPSHRRSSILLHASDPIVMHLLTETALSDSTQFEVLSFEEVERLKKELSFLTNRIDATKRKLALETKLREAAVSLSKLYDKRASRDSGDYSSGSGGSPRSHRRGPSFFGHGSATHNHSDSEVAMSTRKCEELAQELWNLEKRTGDLRRRLLEHTAGVLQMTHKGLKKKNSSRMTDEANGDLILSSQVDSFDDRSLYKAADVLDEFPSPGGGKIVTSSSSGKGSVDLTSIQSTTGRLEELNHRLRVMILEARPSEGFDPIPQNVANGTTSSSMAAVEVHLDYLERGLESMASHQPYPTQETGHPDYETEDRLEDLNTQLEDILVYAGARQERSPHTSTARKAVPEQLDTLGTAIHDIKKRIEGLTEQKTILTTQIQQQRVLNSKSDAERDAHVADLTEQIAHLQRDLATTQQEASDTKEEITTVMGQLDATRQQSMLYEQDRTANDASKVSREELQAKEDEIARLEAAIQQLHTENDEHSRGSIESNEKEIGHLQATIQQLRSETDEHIRDAVESKEKEIEGLQATIQQLRSESDERTRDALELKDEEITYLESAVAQLTSEKDHRIKEAVAEKESEIIRLEESLSQLRSGQDEQIKEATAQKEEEISRLEDALSQIRPENEHQKSRGVDADGDGEVARLEMFISQLRSEEDRKSQELADKEEALARAEHAISELRSEQDTRVQEALESKQDADNQVNRFQSEYSELENEMIRLQTELTLVKAELDGAYGNRAQRAAEAAVNPAFQKKMEDLSERNIALTEELATLRGEQGNRNGNPDLQQRVQLLETELRGTIDDYEALTKASIEFEKERDKLESLIDTYRDRCEELESQMYDERIQGLGNGGTSGLPLETTSTMVLKNEFKRMMRQTRAENMKNLRVWKFTPRVRICSSLTPISLQ